MNEAVAELENLRDVGFLALLTLGGLVVLWHRRKRPVVAPLPETGPIPISEVLVAGWLLLVTFSLATLGLPLMRGLFPQTWPAGLVHGLTLQLCLLLGAWQGRRWLAHAGHPLPPLVPPRDGNGARRSFGRAAGEGFLAFLAAFPPVLLTGLAWGYLLAVLHMLDLPVPADAQPGMEIFSGELSAAIRIALIALAVGLAPVTEEVTFRGFLLPLLRSRMPGLRAEWLTALIFAAIHMHIGSFGPLLLLGFLLGRAYLTTSDLRVPIFFHAVFNVVSLLRVHAAG